MAKKQSTKTRKLKLNNNVTFTAPASKAKLRRIAGGIKEVKKITKKALKAASKKIKIQKKRSKLSRQIKQNIKKFESAKTVKQMGRIEAKTVKLQAQKLATYPDKKTARRYFRGTDAEFERAWKQMKVMEYNKAIKAYKRKIVHEQAQLRASRGEDMPMTEVSKGLFGEANFNFKKVYEEGITRKVGTKTVRYKGEEAIDVFIQSLRRRTSRTYQKEMYINNYISALINATSIDESIIADIEASMKKIPADELAWLINTGRLPQIAYVYAYEMEAENDLLEKIYDALSMNEQTKLEYRAVKEETKLLEENYYEFQKKKASITTK